MRHIQGRDWAKYNLSELILDLVHKSSRAYIIVQNCLSLGNALNFLYTNQSLAMSYIVWDWGIWIWKAGRESKQLLSKGSNQSPQSTAMTAPWTTKPEVTLSTNGYAHKTDKNTKIVSWNRSSWCSLVVEVRCSI